MLEDEGGRGGGGGGRRMRDGSSLKTRTHTSEGGGKNEALRPPKYVSDDSTPCSKDHPDNIDTHMFI